MKLVKYIITSLFIASNINNVYAIDDIYLSSKKDEEMVAKLFEIARRIDTSSNLGKWKQDIMKSLTLDCAIQTKVLNSKTHIFLPNEYYSPVLRKEDIVYLTTLHKRNEIYHGATIEACYKISEEKPNEVFNHCSLSEIKPDLPVLENKEYPKTYLVVNSNFVDGTKVSAEMYCEGVKEQKDTRQFTIAQGTAIWNSFPKYQKINFNGWSENLMIGSTKIQFEGFKEPKYYVTIMK